MTQFNKADFSYHGGYLMYTGDYEGRPVYADGPNVHPSNVGRGIDLFIARFKYSGPFTKAKFLTELCKSFTVEEYVNARTGGSPFGHNCNSPLDVLSEKNPVWFQNTMNKWKAKRDKRAA